MRPVEERNSKGYGWVWLTGDGDGVQAGRFFLALVGLWQVGPCF